MPMMHSNLAARAKLRKHCLNVVKNLNPDIAKGNVGETYAPKKPNEVVQLDFWGPVKHLKGRKKCALAAVD